VPNTEIDDVPTAAESAMLIETFWLPPAAIDMGAGGETVIPCGTPCRVMPTVPLKPFCGVTLTVTGMVTPPTTEEIELGDTAKLKSATGGGGDVIPPSPPHALKKITREVSNDCTKSWSLPAALMKDLVASL
jgi:hypothetical protein